MAKQTAQKPIVVVEKDPATGWIVNTAPAFYHADGFKDGKARARVIRLASKDGFDVRVGKRAFNPKGLSKSDRAIYQEIVAEVAAQAKGKGKAKA